LTWIKKASAGPSLAWASVDKKKHNKTKQKKLQLVDGFCLNKQAPRQKKEEAATSELVDVAILDLPPVGPSEELGNRSCC
jgi:hypothetical protein